MQCETTRPDCRVLTSRSGYLQPRQCICRYKDRAAQRGDWKRGHKHECKALACARENGVDITASVRLVARVLWRKREEDASDASSKQPFWKSYASVAALQHHWDRFPDEKRIRYARMTEFIGYAHSCA